MRIFAILVIFLVFTTNGVVNAAALSGLEQETTANVQSPELMKGDYNTTAIWPTDEWWGDEEGNVQVILGYCRGSFEISANETFTIWNVKQAVFQEKGPECDPKHTLIFGEVTGPNGLDPLDDKEMVKPLLMQGERFSVECLHC